MRELWTGRAAAPILPGMKIVALVGAVAVLLAGCSSSLGPVAVSDTPPTPPSSVCDEVHRYIVSTILPTVDSWHFRTNEFDQRVAREFRTEATHLFSFQARAQGAVASALGREATALTNESIAIQERQDTAVATAANASNSALAALRGVCGF